MDIMGLLELGLEPQIIHRDATPNAR